MKANCMICGKNAPYFTHLCDPAETLHNGKYTKLYMCDEHQAQFIKLIRSDIFRMRLHLDAEVHPEGCE